MKRLKEILAAIAAKHEKSRRERRRKRLESAARQRLQLMEHGGRMCISVDGVPLLSREQAGGDLLDTLREMRANYVVYHLGSRYE